MSASSVFLTKLLPAVVLWAGACGVAAAEPVAYQIDPEHSQVVFSFNHHGFSAVRGIVTGITGDISYDKAAPATSSVSAQMPLASLTTGHKDQDGDILAPGFLDVKTAPTVSFKSTSITVVGVNRALISGDLTLNGVTKPIVLDTEMNREAASMKGVPTLGLSAKTTLLRSAFNAGRSAPNNSDSVDIDLSIEASQVAQP